MKTLFYFFCLVLLAFIFLVIIPGYKSACIYAGRAACMQNLNQISGKIESAFLDGRSPEEIFSEDGSLKLELPLYKGKPVSCKFGGQYRVSSNSERLVFCTFHGDLDQKIPGKLDPEYSPLYWLKLWLIGIFK